MPFIRITHNAEISPQLRSALIRDITALMGSALRKKEELTSVLVEQVIGAGWSIGGTPVDKAVNLEATITKGTNSDMEKSLFVKDAMQALRTAFGALPKATYVTVREIPGSDWGYDGETQEFRRVSADASPRLNPKTV